MWRSFKYLACWLVLILTLILIVIILFKSNNKSADSATTPIILEAKYKTIQVNGKSKVVYTIEQPNGTWGYYGRKGEDFNVIVKNQIKVATVIHWHGLILPNAMDGVPGITQAPILPCEEYHYHFPLVQAGTYWMHSHMGLQVQDFMEAPLIIADPDDPYRKDQEVVIMFQDFTFKNPDAILKKLQSSADITTTPMSPMKNTKPDLNDVKYDAFLTNYKTLKDPEIISVQPGKTVRLRFINGAAGSNFWIHTGDLMGTAIAFDGKNIHPFTSNTFQLAIAQRIDVLVNIPEAGGAFPILGQVEGLIQQTGLILVTPGTIVPTMSEMAAHAEPPLNNNQEFIMKSEHPMAQKPIAQVVTLNLTGNMQKYIWMINDQVWPNVLPVEVKKGSRIELVFNNKSGMAHPMHFHGHFFEIVEINHQVVDDGALHDTILVLPHTQVSVILDANYSGKWMLHCHMAYHQAAGMMTYVQIK